MPSICFISTYLNHHNKPICDALYELTHRRFFYVATSNIGEMRKNMGFSQLEADYLLDYANALDKEPIRQVIDDADVVLIGASEPVDLIKKRLKQGKLTFRISERLFKTRSRYLKAPIHWFRSLMTRKAYLLCSSAATARDYNMWDFTEIEVTNGGILRKSNPLFLRLCGRKKQNQDPMTKQYLYCG